MATALRVRAKRSLLKVLERAAPMIPAGQGTLDRDSWGISGRGLEKLWHGLKPALASPLQQRSSYSDVLVAGRRVLV